MSTNVPIEKARATAVAVLKKLGWDENAAKVQADIMVYAETAGNNQGLVKLFDPSQMAPAAGSKPPTVERDAIASCVVNANQSPGMLALQRACVEATTKAKGGAGIAIVGVRNTSTSSGMLAYYGDSIAKQGLVGIIIATSPELVTIKPGARGVFGTNPICFAVPREKGNPPFVFDMSTSGVAFFGAMEARAKGEQLQEGVACHADGTMTTDPKVVLEQGGFIIPFGGHKGAGLSLIAELLGSAMSGGAVLGMVESKAKAKNWGHTVIAINPALLTDAFPSKVESVLATVRASGEGIRLPGDKSGAIAATNTETGTLPLTNSLWESLQKNSKL